MCRRRTIAVLLSVVLLHVASFAQEMPDEPLDSELRESVEVRLVLIDAVVMDRQDRTVSDLALDDFEVTVDGKPVELATLDLDCPTGSMEDPRAVKRPKLRRAASAEAPPRDGRKLVIALDYLHMIQMERTDVLDKVRELVRHDASAGDEIMLVALNGGLRVEQTFTSDMEEIQRALRRMEYDISLWLPDFIHLTDRGFVEGLKALLHLLETVPGPKAMVLYSGLQGDLRDFQYEELAATANAARCAIYTVHAGGLQTLGDPWASKSARAGHG